MRIIRYLAAAATALMSLMNLPFAVDDGGANLPKPLACLVTLLGVAGLVAAVALLRDASWGARAVIAIGGLNLAGAIAAMVNGNEGAMIGLVVSTVMTVLGIVVDRGKARQPQVA